MMVPLARVERALLAELDFESSASTNSATGARWPRLAEPPEGRNSLRYDETLGRSAAGSPSFSTTALPFLNSPSSTD
jgi:hypothetical protein